MWLREVEVPVIYNKSTQNPRACILGRKCLQILSLSNVCLKYSVAVKIKKNSWKLKLVDRLGSTYLPFDSANLPPFKEVKELVSSYKGLDWATTNANIRGKSLLHFIMQNNLDRLNIGNERNCVTCQRAGNEHYNLFEGR